MKNDHSKFRRVRVVAQAPSAALPTPNATMDDFRNALLQYPESAAVVDDVDAAHLSAGFVMHARAVAKLTQEQLANRTGMQQPNVSRLERATREKQGPTVSTLVKIARACGGSLVLEFRPNG